jgi:CHAT domain-containing protein/tetratricopeptide (TPR) repeat protein
MLGMWVGLLALAWTSAADEPPPSAEAKLPWQRLLQGDDAKQARELQERSQNAVDAGQLLEALTAARDLLALRERLQGAEHWEAVDARWQIKTLERRKDFNEKQQTDYRRAQAAGQEALDLYTKGRYAQAQPLFQQSLTLFRQLLGDEHPRTAAGYHNLALNLKAQGKYAEAGEGYRKALDLKRKLLGEEHPETATGYNNLATSLQAQGKYAEAEEGCRKALALYRKLLGEEHPDTANGYNNLAANLQAQAKYAEAEQGFRKSLGLYQKLLGDEHPRIALLYNNLAANLEDQDRYVEAEEDYRKALALYRKRLGDEHPDTVTCSQNLAYNLQKQGKYAEAEEGYRKALALFRRLLGDEHPDTATVYYNLARNLQDQGKYAAAEEGCRKALALFRRLVGDEHPETANGYHSLACNLLAQGKYAEAEEGFRKALTMRRKRLGEEHPSIAASYGDLGDSLVKQGKYAEAEDSYRKALTLCRRLLGEEHSTTAACYHAVAYSLQRQGKYAEAEEGYRKALALRRQRLGEDHPYSATGYHNLALNLQAQGRYAEAEECYRKALTLCRKLLGDEHPETGTCYHHLAQTLAAQQRKAEAEVALGHAAEIYAHARPGFAAAGLVRATTSKVSPLPFQAAVLASQGKLEPAWQRFEQGLGRGLWDDLNARLARSPAEQARLAEIARHLERLDQLLEKHGAVKLPTDEQVQLHKERLTQRGQLQEQLDTLTRQLALKYGVGETQARTLQQVQATLPADTALLGWVDVQAEGKAAVVVNERWAVLLRAKGPPAWVLLQGNGKDNAWTDADTLLPRELAAVLHAHPREGQPDWRPLAQHLYQQRLQSLAPHLGATAGLPAVRHLVVLPSYVMDSVPLEVLTDRYTFSRAPSASVFSFLQGKPKTKTSGLLALADPTFDRPEPTAQPAPVPPGGLLVLAVVPGSNAAKASLRAGDVLLRYADTALKTLADLPPQAAADVKLRIPVEVWRSGETLTVEVAPGRLGVSLAKEPAPDALANRRRIDAEMVASRGDDSWKALPGTRVEVEALSRRFQQAHQPLTLLTDSAASEQRLNELAADGSLAKVRYVHLATHGTVNWDYPLQSALILARDQLPDPSRQLDAGLPVFDARLTAAEVLRDWSLDADLVTLSACETGLGQYARGEGYLGFAQALLIAGTRSVCLSLWQVDDVATALVMDRFYGNLLGQRDGLKQPLGKAEALAEAKAWLRTLPRSEALKLAAKMSGGVERGKGRPALPQTPVVPETDKDEPPYAHPYYWAAFVLVGDND